MSVLIISLLLEIILINKIMNIRINVRKEDSNKLILISVILLIFTYQVNNEINFFYYYLIPVFVFIFYMDIKEYLIINEYNLIFLILGVIYLSYNYKKENTIVFIIFINLSIIIKIYEKLKQYDVIGDGDLKLFIALSLIYGLNSFYAIFIASLIGVIVELFKRIIKKNKTLIPFGPYLVIGYYLILVFFT